MSCCTSFIFFFFFFLMIRRPPRSTLFPYTTLFRSAVGIDLVRDHKQVLAGEVVAPNPDLVGDLLLSTVIVLSGRERAQRVAPAPNVEQSPRLRRVRGLALHERAVLEPVVADRQRLPGTELLCAHLVVRARASDADRQQDDRRVHDVPAVAPPVPRDQLRERTGPRAAGKRAAGACPADE